MALPQLNAEDMRELDRVLGELVSRSEASAALIIDKAGFLIAQTGDFGEFDSTTLAALAAGTFAATQGMGTTKRPILAQLSAHWSKTCAH